LRDKKGQDLTPYYIGQYETPATLGRRLPSLRIIEPVRATTPGTDEQQDGGATPRTDVPLGNVEPSPTASNPAAANPYLSFLEGLMARYHVTIKVDFQNIK
jgi:hypothetical protein